MSISPLPARACLASAESRAEFVQARTWPSIHGPIEKPDLPFRLRHPNYWREQSSRLASTWATPDKGFTAHGRLTLGTPALLIGESEAAFADLFLAVCDYFEPRELWDGLLINDAVTATWEMRRLREAGEVMINCYFRLKARAFLGKVNPSSDRHLFLGLPMEDVAVALRKAGISASEVSAMTLKESTQLVKMIDGEYLRLEQKRRRILKQLIKLQARYTSVRYHKARELELFRKHQWKCV
jgi:hypothetical protein